MQSPKVNAIVFVLLFILWPGQPVHAAPRRQQQATSVPVYAVYGAFSVAQSGAFSHVFTPDGGPQLTAAGGTPVVEQQMDVLAQLHPPAKVTVWGTRYFDPKAASVADLVITDIMVEGDPARPAPASEPAIVAAPVAVVNFSMVNLYSTPGQSMSVVGQARAGESCQVQGRNQSGMWLLVDCGSGQGWIDRRLVNVTDNLSSVPITNTTAGPQPPTAAPTPTPVVTAVAQPASFKGWKTSYFNNANLQGDPVAYGDVANIDFNWGYGSPNPAMPVDYFTARFERAVNVPSGYYRMSVLADDGVRVWVDDELVIDEWHGSTGQQYTANRALAGAHRLRVEFMELVAVASVRFTYEYSAQVPPWRADYYDGAPGRGGLLYSQQEQASSLQLDHNWGTSTPVSGRVPNDNWNGRWTGQFPFESGNYLFRARTDDGVRVYIDQTLIIDAWYDGPIDRVNRFMGIGAGPHIMTIDYYKRTGYGYLQVFWYRDTSVPGREP